MVSSLGAITGDAVVQLALHDAMLMKTLLDQIEAGIYIVDCNRRLLYWNSGAEQITGYISHDVAGRYCHADLLMHCDDSGAGMCGRKCPLLGVMHDGKPRECMLFLRHRNGHRVPVSIRSYPITDASGTVVGALEVFREVHGRNRSDMDLLKDIGAMDTITGLPERKYGEMRVTQALEAGRLFGFPFGWLRVEIDNLETLEHRFGHGMLDAAVRMVARTLQGNLAPTDLATSWGEAEFRVEVHSCSQHGLADLAHKLVLLVRTSNVEWWGDPWRVTVSIAGAMAERDDTLESLEARVEGVMANCSAGGGNRAAVFHVEQGTPRTGEE